MEKKHAEVVLFLLLLMLLLLQVNCRYSSPKSTPPEAEQASSGGGPVEQRRRRPSYGCKQRDGVIMPCTTSVLGNGFLILVYGYLMFLAARLLYEGSEILVELLNPGLTGGVFLPLLSALPDAVIILASRLCGNKSTASSQVSAGSALLGGSTAMLLTLLGGCCVIVSKCDFENSRVKSLKEDPKRLAFAGSCVSTDIRASRTARIMVISVIPFIIIQLSQVLHTTSQISLAVLISLIICISLLLAYCLYQVFQPSILKARVGYAKEKHMMSRIVKHWKRHTLKRLLTANGEPDREVIKKLFKMIRNHSDQQLSASELRALIIGIQIKDKDPGIDDAVWKVMVDFDIGGDAKVDIDAFTRGISKWYHKVQHSAVCPSDTDFQTRIIIDDLNASTDKGNECLRNQRWVAVKIKNPRWKAFKGVVILLLGTLIAATFVHPLVNAVGNFYSATKVPPFFVSFVLLPFASSTEAVSTLIFSGQEKLRTTPLTVSEIYGAVNMNNLLCLSVFLGLLYFRQLTWNFTSEFLPTSPAMIRLFGVDIPAETSTAQEIRESKKRKSVTLSGEELPHPSAIQKIRSSSPPAPPGPSPDTIDNTKGKGPDQVFVAGKILERSDTAAEKRRGSKRRNPLSGQERRKSAIKKTRSSSPRAPLEPLPPPLQQAIYDMAGTKGTEAFVARKIVERSDTEAALNRFFMPKNEKIWELLSEEERRMVEKDGADGGLDVTLVDPSCRVYSMKLKWWKSLKKIVFNSNWRNFVEGCGLKPEVDCVELWSFRSNSKLCFAFNVRRSELHQSVIS